MSHINDPTICEYCHQRPKFLPYDYCCRTCGSLAAAIKNQGPVNPIACKQCNQRPVYQNHQFCGRRCANAFAVTQGQVDMLGYLSTLWSMPWNQSQQVAQAGGQPGQGGGIQGLVNGFRSFISPANQVQQQQMLAYSMQSQQPPNDTFNPISSAGAITTTASQKMAVATLNQSNHNRPGPFNGARPLSLLSIQSTPSGIPALPVLNATNVGTTQPMRSNPAGMSFISRSTQSLSCASEPDDTYPYFDVSDQRVDSDRDLSEDGDGRYGRDEFTVGEVNVQSIGPPDSVGTCTLGGCSNPTIVDSITDLESEYCSWKHQQEAIASKQAESCILCHTGPRGPRDHFCSTRCRRRALSQVYVSEDPSFVL